MLDSTKYKLKKCVFKLLVKISLFLQDLSSYGNLFQQRGA